MNVLEEKGIWRIVDSVGAATLALLWLLPLIYAFWSAFHSMEFATRFSLFAPLTLENFFEAWGRVPFPRYFLNTTLLVTSILAIQLVVSTLAAYAFARMEFPGRDILFALVLMQLMVMPEILIVENYTTISSMGLLDTIMGMGFPYYASAFAIFLLRQTFKMVPGDLEDAARVAGASRLQVLLKVYIPLARPTYVAFGLVSVSYHWNNFLWPLVVTNSVETRPLTVGLSVFGAIETGIDWPIITAGTLITIFPIFIAFVIFQRQFIQSFMHAGVK